MSLSKAERAQLRSLAEMIRHGGPAMAEPSACFLEAFVLERDPTARALEGAIDERQVALFAPAAPVPTPPTRVEPVEKAVMIADAPDHSSSSDLKISDLREKKTDRLERVTLAPGAPLDDTFRAIYDRVRAERAVDLPPVESVWDDFVDYVVEHRKHWATRGGLKIRWKSWCRWEKPDAPPAAPSEPPASSVRPVATSVHRESTELLAENEAQRNAAAPFPEAARLATSVLDVLEGRRVGPVRPPPRRAVASQRRDRGPPGVEGRGDLAEAL